MVWTLAAVSQLGGYLKKKGPQTIQPAATILIKLLFGASTRFLLIYGSIHRIVLSYTGGIIH